MAWPTSYDSLTPVSYGSTVQASEVNTQSSIINTLESVVGLLPQNGYATVAAALAALEASPNIVTGTVYVYAGTTAPTGYLMCDGSSYSTTTYAALYAVIGTTFGFGTGTFNVPNLLGSVAMGAGVGPGLTHRRLGDNTGGELTHVLVTTEMPPHTHTYVTSTPFLIEGTTNNQAGGTGNPPGGTTVTTPTTSTAGSGTAHSNIQPNMALNFIIKT